MRRIAFLFILLFVSSHGAFSYDIQLTGNMPLTDKISGIGYQASGIVAISSETKTLYVIDTSSGSILKQIPLDIIPSGVAVDSKRNSAIVSSQDGAIHFIDLETGNTTRTLSVKRHSELVSESINIHSIALNPPSSPFSKGGIEGDFDKGGMGGFLDDILYIGNSNSLMVLDLKTEEIIKEITLPNAVTGMAVDNNLGYLLALSASGISIYNSETLEQIALSPVWERVGVRGISVNPSTHIAVLTNKSDNSISIIPLSSCIMNPASCIGNHASGISLDEPSAIAIDSLSNRAFIAHKDGIAIVKLKNPFPIINALIPESSRAGDSGFTLSIKGEKFVLDTKARFDTKELITKFQDNYNLQADVPSSELKSPRNVDISVVNPLPGGGISNTLKFSIYNPAPVLDSITPDIISPTSITIRAMGKNFFNGSIVNLNGENLKTRFISSILLEAELNPSIIKSIGQYAIVVINPSPGAYTSNAVYLNVVSDLSTSQLPNLPSSGLPDTSSSQLSGVGSLTGRILNEHKQPVEGVTVKIKNIIAQTDSNGYFRLDNVPAGKRHVMIHGETARDKESRYPAIPLTINIQADIVNEMPFQIYLHKQKNRNFKHIDHMTVDKIIGAEAPQINISGDLIITDPEVHGFEMRISRGVKIIGWDGQPNQKISVRTLSPDRLPMKPLPNNTNVRTVYMFYFDKVGGGIPDRPLPVKSPNDLGLLPGEKAILWYYDESPNEGEAPNEWTIAGTGTVTPDGKYIVSDPGFGIPKFCCGAGAWGGSGGGGPSGPGDCLGGCCDSSGGPSGGGEGGGGGGGPSPPAPSPTDGDPVDLATGYFLHKKTDLHIPGIIPVNITRYYRSRDSGSAVQDPNNLPKGLGAFGKGTYLEYDWWLGAYGADGNPNDANPTMLLLIKPGNYQYRFTDPDEDGIFTNPSDPGFKEAVVTYNTTDETRTLRMRDGWKYKFDYKEKMSGELIEIEDRYGNKLAFSRTPRPSSGVDHGGYITEITTPEGRRTIFNQTYVGSGGVEGFYRTDEIVDNATGKKVKYSYETDPFSVYPRLKTVTYPDGGAIEYRYDASGRMSEIINERGIREVLNEYYDDELSGKKDRIFRQTHIDGGTYIFDYTIAAGNITETTMTSPNGTVNTWRLYDDAGNFYDGYIVKKTTSEGATTYNRELGTNPITSVTDPLGREMSYIYYPNGQVETITDNLGNVTRYEYEPNYGLTTKITDANLKDTTFTHTFDANNKLIKTEMRDPLLHLTTTNYNSYGLPTSITDPNGNTTTFLYENTERPAELTKIISPSPINSTTTMTYDNAGRLWTVTDAKGKSTSYGYDFMDRIIEVKDAIDGITRYTYGATGNLLTVTDAKNQIIRYEYDERDRIKKMTDQLGREEIYTYYSGAEITLTTGDNLKSITDRKGQVTTFNEYDSMNRVKKITYHDGSYVTYTYDSVGRVLTVTDTVTGTIQYTYSGGDKITRETTPLGIIDYNYDAIGRRTSMTVQGQPIVNYIYDDASRLTDINTLINGVAAGFSLRYDDAGRRTSLTLPNGVTTNYTYDNANRLLNLQHLDSLSQVLESIGYTYDPNGNRITMNRPSVTLPFRDAVTNTSYNDANQMLSFNDKNIVYDNNGNMLSVTNTCGTTTYTWDVRNRLVGINGFKPDCTSLTASFKYDAIGRRIEKTINGTTTQYLYDGQDIIQEKQNGVVTANYIRGLNIDEPLLRSTQNAVRYYVRDALGSIIGLTTDTGQLTTVYSYDPFGNATVAGEASDNPFQYTGRENDDTGLYYYRARYYSPELQRFISEDPIRDEINYFIYAANNPLRYTDPMGLAIWICSRKTKFGIGNHAYFWDDHNGSCCGMGSTKSCKEKGPFGGDNCRKVDGSDGLENKVMQCCKETADKGIWFPPVNDCHEAVNDCLSKCGLKNSGAPGGRLGPPCDPCSK